MNWGIEAVGIIAGACIFGAMAFKKLIVIKAFLLAGAVAFLTYSLLWMQPAGIIINIIGICIGIYGLVSAIKSRKKGLTTS